MTRRVMRRSRRSVGATSTEYILILGLVVLPLGMLGAVAVRMLTVYGWRMIDFMTLPFP